VAVAIVIHDDAPDLPECLHALARQTRPAVEVVVVDCASNDGGPAVARRLGVELGLPLAVRELGENRGFAGGMNAAIAASNAPWVLTLNADARLGPAYLERLLARAARHPELRIGALTGRLLRFAASDRPDVVDACGMYLTRTWRHLDRSAGEVDRGQHQTAERVFGGTGAATLFRRAALADVAFADGAVFDPDFFTFREDAELAFRLQTRGWEAIYEPAAEARHRRSNLPERRRLMPQRINLHTLKNRYLLRFYHQTLGNAVRTLVPTLGRDLGAFAWVLLRERPSLAAYSWLWQHRDQIGAKRAWIQSRRSVPPSAIDRWFRHRALALPAGPS
jgi:GT2 family glycosyltransferase